MPAACGDGAVDTGEQCDDANAIDTDACPSSCLNAFCGDGFVQAGVEQCDDGNVPRYGATSAGSLINVEIRLYETTNVIEVHYGAAAPGTAPTTFSASVGWESPDGAVGANVLGCVTNCGLTNWPTDTIYRYTP